MNSQIGISQLTMLLLILVTISACASSSTTQTATAVPVVPTATNTATVTTVITSTPEPTATLLPPTATMMPPTSEPTTTMLPPTATMLPTEEPEESARYHLSFEATWSETTHPADFPSNPHFSGLIGAVHSDDIRLWREGEPATPGIENMAETGGKSPLDSEIEALIAERDACEIVSGEGIALSPGAVTVEFTASRNCPLVTVVSMIAPSPDWFVGVTGLRLYGDEGWIEEWEEELYPYDAGTDSGKGYTSPDKPTEEGEGIHRIETGPLLVEGQIPSLGVFRFTRLNE